LAFPDGGATFQRSGAKFRAELEPLCGKIHESRITNVPWSTIPAIQKIFQKLYPNAQFAICPEWKQNYSITPLNIVDKFKDLCSMRGLLFDDNIQQGIEELFSLYPKEIYLIQYPKAERLSPLHFALLGHEIGHIFAEKWYEKSGAQLVGKINDEFLKIALAEFDASPFARQPLFRDNMSKTKAKQALDVFARVIKELVADAYGTMLFGKAFLVSAYLFSLRKQIDDGSAWESGYLSWRYRILYINAALGSLAIKKPDPATTMSIGDWENLVEDLLKQKPVESSATNPYLTKILQTHAAAESQINDDVIADSKDEVFAFYLKADHVNTVEERLYKGITPNATLDNDLKETPIEFRNILYGTFILLAKVLKDTEYQNYEDIAGNINRLSIKGIELSIEQENFRDAHP